MRRYFLWMATCILLVGFTMSQQTQRQAPSLAEYMNQARGISPRWDQILENTPRLWTQIRNGRLLAQGGADSAPQVTQLNTSILVEHFEIIVRQNARIIELLEQLLKDRE